MNTRQPWEIEADVHYSKKGLADFIESEFVKENPANDDLWVRKVKTPAMSYFMKKGGSHLN